MRLSEQLKQDHDCGDFGKALEGYAERAEALEEIVKAVAHIGIDWGYGKFELEQRHIDQARKLDEADAYQINKLKRNKMVTKEDVDKAKAAAVEADAAADTAVKASYGAWDKYIKLREEFKNGKG